MAHPHEALIHILRIGETGVARRVAACHVKVAEGRMLIDKDAAGQVE